MAALLSDCVDSLALSLLIRSLREIAHPIQSCHIVRAEVWRLGGSAWLGGQQRHVEVSSRRRQRRRRRLQPLMTALHPSADLDENVMKDVGEGDGSPEVVKPGLVAGVRPRFVGGQQGVLSRAVGATRPLLGRATAASRSPWPTSGP